jgi:uncharacterized protein YaaN involved in tellurite resistance
MPVNNMTILTDLYGTKDELIAKVSWLETNYENHKAATQVANKLIHAAKLVDKAAREFSRLEPK